MISAKSINFEVRNDTLAGAQVSLRASKLMDLVEISPVERQCFLFTPADVRIWTRAAFANDAGHPVNTTQNFYSQRRRISGGVCVCV